MYHIFLIHSSVNAHLGCFHVLAIVNSAAMNIGVHVSFQIMVVSGYMPRSGIAGSCGALFSVFFLATLWQHVELPVPPAVEVQRLNHWTTRGGSYF